MTKGVILKNIDPGLADRLYEAKKHGVKPTFHNTRLFLNFSNELCYGYLRFEGNGKIPLGR